MHGAGAIQYQGPADLSAAWAGSATVAAGQTGEIGRLNVAGYEHEYQLLIRVSGAPAQLTLTSFFNGGAVAIRHDTVLGDGGGWTLPPAGSWRLDARNLSAVAPVQVDWLLSRKGDAGLHAPYDFVVTGLAEGAGVPGPWTDLSDIGTTTQGWAPPDRQQLMIAPSASLDFRFIDVTALTTFSFFNLATPLLLKHPGRARLQVRHPGAGVDLRNVIACWNRA